MNPYEKATNDAEIDLRNRVDRICRELRIPDVYRQELISAGKKLLLECWVGCLYWNRWIMFRR